MLGDLVVKTNILYSDAIAASENVKQIKRRIEVVKMKVAVLTLEKFSS